MLSQLFAFRLMLITVSRPNVSGVYSSSAMSLSDFSLRFVLRITVLESILGVSDPVTPPTPRKMPARSIGCHRILVDVSGHSIPKLAGFVARTVEVCGSLRTSLEIGASTTELGSEAAEFTRVF